MKKAISTLVVACSLAIVSAQSNPILININARGSDVNGVLADVFTQAKKSFVIQPNLHFALYLSLNDAPYDKALRIICEQANLEADLRDGVIFITKAKPKTISAPASKPFEAQKPAAAEPKPQGPPMWEVMSRKVTLRLKKAEVKTVLGEISKMAKVPIEINENVPTVKLDAFLVKTSVKYALDKITKAAGLTYATTERGTIKVAKA